MIASDINETNELAGRKSFEVEIELITGDKVFYESSEVASGNLTFSRKVDFALAGTSKIDFWCEIASTPKTSFSWKTLKSGTKNDALGRGVQNRCS